MVYRNLWFPKTVCRARVSLYYFSPRFIRDWSLELLHRLEAPYLRAIQPWAEWREDKAHRTAYQVSTVQQKERNSSASLSLLQRDSFIVTIPAVKPFSLGPLCRAGKKRSFGLWILSVLMVRW
jgi:hypothetical protein